MSKEIKSSVPMSPAEIAEATGIVIKCGVKCKYDPRRDIEKVVSGLAPDINDMLRTGIVFSGSVDTPDNSIDEPSAIVGMIRDEFAAIDAMRVVKKYGKNQEKAVAAAQQEAVSVGAPAPSNSTASE